MKCINKKYFAVIGSSAKRVYKFIAVSKLFLHTHMHTATKDAARRRELLDEAAHAAKDLAARPDRAITYLMELAPLRPADAQLAASLERLLEARHRHADLVTLWTIRLPAALQRVPQRKVALGKAHMVRIRRDEIGPVAGGDHIEAGRNHCSQRPL